MQVTLEIPASYLVNHGPDEFGRRITLYAALLMFRSGELSAGGAAELAGLDRFAFAEECRRHDIALVDYPAAELRDEIASLEIPS
jgi:predicted HTH domain antitoxin